MNIFKHILCLCVFSLSVSLATASTLKVGDYEDYRNHSVVVKGSRSFGTGVVVDASPDGKSITILTANHVLRIQKRVLEEDADGNMKIKLKVGYADSVLVSDQYSVVYTANVIARDTALDVALVRITSSSVIETTLKPVPHIRTSSLFIGEDVFILGNKLALTWSFSFGKIMEPRRLWPGAQNEQSFIQTDAITNVGDSGGGLFDARGSLIGIILLKHQRSLVGFAIPVSDVCKLELESKMKEVFHCVK